MNNYEPSIFKEFAESEKKRRKKRKKLLFFLFFIFFCSLLLFLLFSRIWDPLWNPFRPKPEEIINRAIEKLPSLENFKTEVDMTFSFEKPKKGEIFNFNSHFSVFNVRDEQKKERLKIPFNISLFLKKTTIQFDYRLDGELRKINQNLYLKINNLSPDLELLLRILNVNFGDWKDKWLKKEGVQEDFLHYLVLANENKLFFVERELNDTYFEGKKVYHLLLLVKKDDVLKILSSMPGYSTGFEQIADRIGDVEIDVFIDKKDFILYYFSIKKTIDLSNIPSFEGGKMDFKIEGKIGVNEKGFEILEPPIYEKMDEFLDELSKILNSPFFSFFQGFFSNN